MEESRRGDADGVTSPDSRQELLEILKVRFEKNAQRHPGVRWEDVEARLGAQPEKLVSLAKMEATGGEPDMVAFGEAGERFVFCDCSPESPVGRRSLCYDEAALQSRKEHKPAGSAMGIAAEMGIELLDEEQYAALQKLGEFDQKTSSWLQAPEAVRRLGGGIFGDRRYGRVFTYHNGAESYYASRGFRGLLRV